ncbi:2,5-diamino-6-(ribosylamino)-4(3H)-pyrimidinone 5'-phosphate reductase [Coemansia brasiliensis]|uniref:2,5-diamino-6-ribosylamino-4(3H)-pyrimidinone 5'-phosphate reductase n=1 Tax=Coemansia brasiliensis TaxID=2650707 RepID=A0A9W8I6E5_9FUNG|nr:2,5-diamino-6-(ribosylamino)-4(3H)-pyrimidinone 5'-phosphate reductase [Coemansia brasiliensis]
MDDCIYSQAASFVSQLPQSPARSHKDQPAVTLTFAQSLDGKISLPNHQLHLSGPESMAMTHHLRAVHDAILVGVETVICDNPQLNVRHMSQSQLSSVENPQPVVLDSRLRIPLNARLLTAPQTDPRLKMPLIFTGPQYDPACRTILERMGAHVIVVSCSEGRLQLNEVMRELQRRGILRLMVEGGARVIQSFMASDLCTTVIITIAPIYVGSEGVSASLMPCSSLNPQLYQPFGRDVVMVANSCIRDD